MLGKKIVTIYKSVEGCLGVGLFRSILAVQDDKKIYMPVKTLQLEFEFLSLTPSALLSSVAFLYWMAKEKGIILPEGDD